MKQDDQEQVNNGILAPRSVIDGIPTVLVGDDQTTVGENQSGHGSTTSTATTMSPAREEAILGKTIRLK